jgi:iron complex outermembrane receptor protein
MRSHALIVVALVLVSREGGSRGAAPVPIEQFEIEDLLDAPVTTASGGVVEERAVAPANVISFSRAEIARRGWRSLAEVLANTPGVYVIDDHVSPSLGVRGVTGGIRAGTRIVKVMVNGVAVNFRPARTAFLGPEYIPMEVVERIEIAQGPLSALYGANAFLATVNVITRRGGRGLSSDVAGRVTAVRSHAGGGASIVASQAGAGSGLVVAFSMDRIDRSGVAIRETFEAQDPTLERYRAFFAEVSKDDVTEPMTGFLQLYGGDPRDLGRITLQGGVQRHDAIGEFQLGGTLTHKTRSAIVNAWSNLHHELAWSETLSTDLDFGVSGGAPTRDDRQYLTGNENAYWTRNMRYWAIDAAAEATWSPLGERLRLQLGGEAEYDRERVAFYTQHFLVPVGEREAGETLDLIGAEMNRHVTLVDLGVKLQVTSTPAPELLPGLALTANARVDYLSYGDIEFPLQPSFRAAAAYRFTEDYVVKVVGGHAFQAPSAVLMFSHPGYGTANNLVGNALVHDVVGLPELRPQKVTSAELIGSAGLRVLALEAGVYYQRIDDPIEFEPIATDFVAANLDVRQHVGGLAMARGGVERVRGYTSLAVQREVDPPDGRSGPPPLYPDVFGTVGVDVDVEVADWALLGNANLRWVGARGASNSNILYNNNERYTLPPYAEIDLTLSTAALQLFGDGSTTTVVASVRNLLDDRHAEPGFGGFDVPNVGRLLWVELRQRY